MSKYLPHLVITAGLLPLIATAAEPVKLTEDTYKADLGMIVVQVNWGRAWKCGQFENAQLQALTFTKSPIDNETSSALALETPSKLSADNQFLPYTFVIEPGEYALTAFDVKVARSITEVAHIKGSTDDLIEDGKPIGGSFTVGPGEVVYIGHFGLDCGAEPFLWRNYIEGRKDFERYVNGFRQQFPFVKHVPVRHGLFETQLFGNSYSLKDPVVK
ncbi:hypothetical protein [uncultured Limnobacter sp.]|uniref:hypothetical protein n=1 Tax=uncultured Limnobacter sp. TaxID=199681 RepID=UPI0030FC8152